MPITISCTPCAAAALHDLVDRRDEALAAFEREALLPDVLRLRDTFEAFGGRQPIEDVLALLGRELRVGADRFEALLHPALLLRVADVHELGADRAAVRLAQRLHDLAQRRLLETEIGIRRRVDRRHVGFGEVVERRLELGDLRTFLALQRIEVRPARAEETVCGDQLLDIDLLRRQAVGRGVRRRQPAVAGALRERRDDRRMRHVDRVAAVGCRDVLQLVEVLAPVVGDRAGIVQIGLVELFDIRGVAAEEIGVDARLLHHDASPFPGHPGFEVGDPGPDRPPLFGHAEPRIAGAARDARGARTTGGGYHRHTDRRLARCRFRSLRDRLWNNSPDASDGVVRPGGNALDLQKRNNITVAGDGPATMVFVHGFGCDQNMWRLLAPAYEGRLPHRALRSRRQRRVGPLRLRHRQVRVACVATRDDLLEIIMESPRGRSGRRRRPLGRAR